MKLINVISNSEMPREVRSAFFEACQSIGNGYGNDCYIKWYSYADYIGVVEDTPDEDVDSIYLAEIGGKNELTVNKWILDTFSLPATEEIIIEHSW